MYDYSILIKNALIVTINDKMDIIGNGYLLIKDDTIIAIDSGEPSQEILAEKIIDAKGNIILPGLINAHTHIAMSFLKGIADDLPLEKWLVEYIWPVEGKLINQKFIYDSSLYGAAELVKNGITLFNDMYFLEKETAKAAVKVGIRGVVGEGIVDFPFAGFQKPEDRFSYIEELCADFKQSPLIVPAIAPHSIYTCSPSTLKKTAEFAHNNNLLIHLHLSETGREVEECYSKNSKRPVKFLRDLNFFENNRVLAAHGVWLDDQEIEILSALGVSIALNMESNLKLASGFPPLRKFIAKALNFCLGTDGVASNNNLSILEEMDIIAKLYKGYYQDSTFLPAADVVRAATINAAKALGLDDIIGSLEPGKKADLIMIDINNIESRPIYNVYSHLVYNISSDKILLTVINGKIVMENRKLVNIDELGLIELADHYQKEIMELK